MADNTAQKKTERLHMLISPNELEEIDAWRFENRIGTRAEAVRRLVRVGLRGARFAELYGAKALDLSKWAYEEVGDGNDEGMVSIPAERFNEIRHVLVSLMVHLGRAEMYARSPHFAHLLSKDEHLKKLVDEAERQEEEE